MATSKKQTSRDFPLSATPTPQPMGDSTFYYANKEYISKLKALTAQTKPEMDRNFKEMDKAREDRYRQSLKNKPGYDAMGFPKKQ